MLEERTTCHTPTPGKQPTRIPTWKYEAIRKAILSIIPEQPPGIMAKALPDAVAQRLDPQTREKIGSITWHTTAVKLNMEVEGELHRLPGKKPQHLIRRLTR